MDGVDELMEMGDYREALAHLTDVSDEQVRYKRVVCLNSLGEYKIALEEAKEAKRRAKDTYYDVVATELDILKELEEYEEATDILIEELSMPYIPYKYESLYNEVYDEILLLKQEKNEQLEEKKKVFSIQEIANMLDRNDVNPDLLYMAIEQLEQMNARLILSHIQDYLMDEKKEPYAKSLLMEIMIEQQIDEEMEVVKYHTTYDFNPSLSPYVLEQNAYAGIYEYMEKELDVENPTLLEQCLEFLEYFLYAYYPKTIEEDEYHVYAGAIHYYVATLMSIEVDEDDIEIAYQCDMDEVEEKILALKVIEC